MIRKKWGKFLAACITAALFTGITMNVHAQSVKETEPNDTMETAETISANRQTPQEYMKGDNSNSYVVKGYVSTSDEDWFKVYLNSAQDSYFSIYSDILYFQIYDSNGNPVTEEIYETDATSHYHVYDFNHLPTGYYYVRLRGTRVIDSYQFLFGNPVYRTGKVIREGERISLSSGNTKQEDIIDFTYSDCPEKAQVTTILIGGVNSGYADKVEVAYSESPSTFIKTYSAAWGSIDVPFSYNYGLDGAYTFSYTYKNDKTFTPIYSFYYIYPTLP